MKVAASTGPVLMQLAFAPGLLDHHAEAVVGADVRIEVDVVLEDLVGQRVDVAAEVSPALRAERYSERADLAAEHDGAGGAVGARSPFR